MSEEGRGERAAYGLILVYFLLEYLRPQDHYLPFLAPLRVPGLVELGLATLWLLACPKWPLRERPVRSALVFLAVMASTVVFATNREWALDRTQTIFLALVAGALPAATLLGRSKRMLSFLEFWVATQTLLAFAGLLNGGRGTGSFLLAESDLALALCMAIPYPFFLQMAPGAGRLKRAAYLGSVAVMFLGVVSTRSQVGLFGLVLVLVLVGWLSRRLVRRAVLALALATALMSVAVATIQPTFFHDLTNAQDPEESSGGERIEAWELGWGMFVDRPVLGVGAGNYPWNVQAYRLRQSLFYDGKESAGAEDAYSLYITLLAELGAVGAGVFLVITFSLNRRLRNLVRRVKASPRESDMADTLALAAVAMQCSLVTFLVGSIFVSALYYPHLWYLVGFTVGLERALDDVYSAPDVLLSKPELVLEHDLPPISV
ncbi:MAG: O-antigen ligase family protein [Myxococcota bacterium]